MWEVARAVANPVFIISHKSMPVNSNQQVVKVANGFVLTNCRE